LHRDTQIAAISDLVAPALASLGLDLFDLHFTGSGRARTLQVVVERVDAGAPVDLDTIALASQTISPLLDDAPFLDGPYLLEVTSPGVERPLRRPEHFRRAIGETVSVKYRTAAQPERCRGTLTAVGDDAIEVDVEGDVRRLAFADIADARTVFEWGPSPRPGQPGKRGRARQPARQKEKSPK
jgi:ribosome maturation factor RimP